MGDIIFDNYEQVLSLLNDAKYLGSGREGDCYKIKNKTYKFYNSANRILLNSEDVRSELLKFKEIYINNVYFIRSLILVQSSIVGTVTDYAVGDDCGKIYLHRRNLDKLINSLSRLKKTIFEISKLGIFIDENYLPNILYDGIDFKFIDTGGYFYLDLVKENKNLLFQDDILHIYKINMENIMKSLFVNITNKYYVSDNFIYNFLWYIDSPYKYYLSDPDLMVNPDETIIGIRDTIQEYIGYEIQSFSNCRSDLLKIRKIK